ncbi:MAG: GNAT family N-acetyltransferase [Acidimicrobiales bacterium]
MPHGAAVEVRIGSVEDVQALAALRYEWRVGERGERGLDPVSFEAALSEWMRGHTDHIPFLALRGSTPIGMAWLAVVDRVPGPEQFTRRSAYVQSVYVVEHERAAGVGSKLMELVTDHARDMGLGYLAVHPSERAFSLYHRMGFEGTGRVLELRF